MQQFIPGFTPWHVTFGTFGTRNHRGDRPTVDKTHNQRGEPFVGKNEAREASARGRMKFPARYLTKEQQIFIEAAIPAIAQRGGWRFRTCSGAPDHVHVVRDIEKSVHGETVRRLIKRWLGQELTERWPLPEGATWWAEEGSNKPIDTLEYLENAFKYVFGQRATPNGTPSDGAEDGPARL
jgi:hypothetical protein